MSKRPASNSRNAIADSNPARPPAATSACNTSLALGSFQNRAKVADQVRTVASSLSIRSEMPARPCSIWRRSSWRRCSSLTSPFQVFGSPPISTRHWDIESRVAAKAASVSLVGPESSGMSPFCTDRGVEPPYPRGAGVGHPCQAGLIRPPVIFGDTLSAQRWDGPAICTYKG